MHDFTDEILNNERDADDILAESISIPANNAPVERHIRKRGRPKKIVRTSIDIEKDLYQEFLNTCFEYGYNRSRILRRFMHAFSKDPDGLIALINRVLKT